MKTNITLSIPTPCSQKWSSLTQRMGGRHCSTCSKIVVDFTLKTDDEIATTFANTTGKVCGRFRPEQLITYSLGRPQVKPALNLLKAGAAALVLVLLTKPSVAQDKKERPRTEQGHKKVDHKTLKSSEPIEIRGTIVDKLDKSALPGISIVLKGTTVGTATDVNGKFTFPQKLQPGDLLIINFVGYETKEFPITKNMDSDLELELCMDVTTLGEVAVEGVYESPSVFQRAWRKVKNAF